MGSNPAGSLKEGLDLGNGWKVLKRLSRRPNSTGGCFSVGYKVISDDGKEAFLKALDFSEALKDKKPIDALRTMTVLYTFERDLLAKCKDRKLSRILTPICDGQIVVEGFGDWGLVHYLIFELAKGDIRNVQQDLKTIDLLWCLNSLHDAAVGLKQLHQSQVAHQDIKPSNVLVMDIDGSKLTDLGRASDQNQHCPWDNAQVAGDGGYAPIDLYYKDTGVDGFEKRILTDIYLLGSLFFFHFSGVSAVHAIRSKLQGMPLSGTSFQVDLPYLQDAFEKTLSDFQTDVEHVAGKLSEPIVLMARQLCDPDPTKRGDPKWKGSIVPRYDLQRYISSLDAVSKRLECGML